MIVAPVSSEGVSSLWCLGSSLDLVSIPWLRTHCQRMSWSLVWWSICHCWKRVLLFGLCWTGLWCWHHGLCHPSHRWTHHHVWPIFLGIGLWCHPFSSERYLGSFWVQMVHKEICTCWGVCWMLWGVKLPLSGAFQRRPCCHPPWKIWLLLWVHGLSSWRVGALWFSWMMALFKSFGLRHILNFHLPSWGMWESWPMVWAQSVWWWFLDVPSLPALFMISSLYSIGTFYLSCWTGRTVGSVLMSYSPDMSPMQLKLLGNNAWRSLVLSMDVDPGST